MMKKPCALLTAVAIMLLAGCASTQKDIAPEAPDSGSAFYAWRNAAPEQNSGAQGLAAQHESALLGEAAQTGVIAVLELDEALRIAESERPELAAVRYKIGAAAGDALQAGLFPNPTVAFALEGVTPNTDDGGSWIPGISGPGAPDQLQQIVGVSQPLPLSGTPRLARKAGLLGAEKWREEYERLRLELHSEVKQAFTEVLYGQESLTAVLDLARTLEEILQVTRVQVEAGEMAEVELIKGEADHERFALEVESARMNLAQSKKRLAHALGKPSLVIEDCAGTLPPELPALRSDLPGQLHESHPQARVWKAEERAAEARVAVADSRRWPTPTLGVAYRGYQETDQDTFDITLELEIPLFDRKQGERMAERERAKQVAASVAIERNRLGKDIAEVLASYSSRRARAKVYRDAILPKMEESLAIARTRFESGDTSMLEVLDAYRSLAEARLAHLRELHAARSHYYDIEYVMPTAFR